MCNTSLCLLNQVAFFLKVLNPPSILYVICYMLYVICYMLYVICYMLYVIHVYRTLPIDVICHMFYPLNPHPLTLSNTQHRSTRRNPHIYTNLPIKPNYSIWHLPIKPSFKPGVREEALRSAHPVLQPHRSGGALSRMGCEGTYYILYTIYYIYILYILHTSTNTNTYIIHTTYYILHTNTYTIHGMHAWRCEPHLTLHTTY
jgi:hypothetical protein